VEKASAKVEEVIKQPAQIVAKEDAVRHYNVKQTIKKQNSGLPAVNVEQLDPNLQQIAQTPPATARQNEAFLAAVKPDNTAPAIAALQINDEVKLSPITASAAQDLPVKTTAAAQPKKRRIRSFGDLINVVVSKVDKRKDKLIEFSSKDDDESLVTGINLGIIRVKKEEVIATNK
jgi:hypothetical protein